MAKKNQIIVDMPFAVCKGEGALLIEARFRSISDAEDFRELMAAKWPVLVWTTVHQVYTDRGVLVMERLKPRALSGV